MLNETLKNFGYPETVVKEYGHWALFYRQRQVTLGSLILLCKDEVDAFSKISEQSFAELPNIIKEVETKLKSLFQNDKINYLMLMMVDPSVHFHIIPRYASDKTFTATVFKDMSWPRKPNTDLVNEIGEDVANKLIETLRRTFN
ncbi:MAG TPA: HIT family protein [Patescibacteria group bacterium]|nr:HIT family protein [Patescibacteria group bacterium]